MKKQNLIIFLVVVIGCFSIALAFNKSKHKTEVIQIHQQVQEKIDSLQYWYDKSWKAAVESKNEQKMQASFLQGRRIYKQVEWAVEYFFPTTAKGLNGAPLPEIEVEEHAVFEPSGFQVIEELIYPYEAENWGQLQQESNRIQSILYRLQVLWKDVAFRDDQVWGAIRLQLLRIASLGLAGFDTPLAASAIKEIDYSLNGIENVVAVYLSNKNKELQRQCLSLFAKGHQLIRIQPDIQAFDRHTFLREALLPLAATLLEVQQLLKIPEQEVHAVNLKVPSFFDSGAFNINFFTPDALSWITKEKISLGKTLFHDPILSSNGKVSCGSCHLPEKAFTDGLEKSRSFGAEGFLQRNTPTLLYAGLQQRQFYDMRASFLEDQVKNVVENKDEIHGSLEEAATKMNKIPKYKEAFSNAFASGTDSINAWNIQVVLAAYVRSLAPFNSRFDQHMRGNISLNENEISGFNIFMGKAKCGTCHFMPVFNGTIPPAYMSTESEVIGVPADKAFTKLSKDSGRYHIYKIPVLQFAFKTPTVRNIELTAPYMHNGVFTTLEEVIDFYDGGGAAGRGKQLLHQTLPADSLKLTEIEKRNLVLFLKTLTDESLK